MALTIVNNPPDFCSVNSEVLFIVEEPTKTADPITYPNYKFILDVYTSTGTFLGRLKSQPHPTTKLGIFDISKILQSQASHALTVVSTYDDYSSRIQFYVKVGEEYNDTVYLNLITDSTRSVYKTYKRRPFYESNVLANNGLATNMPSTITVLQKPTLAYQLVPYFSNVSGVTDLTITYKNSDGSTLSTSTVSNAGFQANYIRQYKITNSNENTSYILLSGPFDRRINVQCTKYPVRYLAWLNPYGAYDSLTFGLVSLKTTETEKKSFGRLPYEISDTGDINYGENNSLYGQKRTFAAKTKTRMKLTSHLLTDAEYTWLADLFSSTDVYMYDDTTGYWMPVQITSGTYEYRTYLNSRLKPLEFEVEFTDEYNSQFL